MGIIILLLWFVGIIHCLIFGLWAAFGAVLLIISWKDKSKRSRAIFIFCWFLICAGLFWFLKETMWVKFIMFYMAVGARMMEVYSYFNCMFEVGFDAVRHAPWLCTGLFH